jgi:hypothetical protein
MRGKKRHDFDTSFRRSINALFKSNEPMEYKNSEVERMIEGYVAATGEYPSETFLEMLADVLLSDMLRDNDMTKIQKTEYPILSTNQMKRRNQYALIRGRISHGEILMTDEKIQLFTDYHLNTLAQQHLVYKPPMESFEKSIKDTPKVDPVEKQPIYYFTSKKYGNGSRTENDAKWSRAVKDRDGYCCQNPKCNSRVGIMHAHHIESYVDNPDVRTMLSNGVTLCNDCHIEFHSIFGKGGNNRTQIEAFFANMPA